MLHQDRSMTGIRLSITGISSNFIRPRRDMSQQGIRVTKLGLRGTQKMALCGNVAIPPGMKTAAMQHMANMKHLKPLLNLGIRALIVMGMSHLNMVPLADMGMSGQMGEKLMPQIFILDMTDGTAAGTIECLSCMPMISWICCWK